MPAAAFDALGGSVFFFFFFIIIFATFRFHVILER